MVSRFERFSYAITEAYRCLRKLEADEMAKYSLRGSCAVYLTSMYRFPEGITAARLSEECGRNKADVSRAIAEMQLQGLVSRADAKGGNYRTPLFLTETGRQAAESLGRLASSAVTAVSGRLSNEHIALFYQAMEHICKNLKMICDSGIPEDSNDF